MYSRTILVAAAASLLVPGAVWALEYGFGVGYAARYTDNVTLVPQDAVSDIVSYLVGNGNILVQTPRLDLGANGGIALTSYAHDSYESRSIETFNGNAIYTFAPNRLTWTVGDTLQDTRISSLLALTPDNLEQTNRFSTGPDVTLRTSSRNTMGLKVRYENDWYETSDNLSNNRGVGELNWQYRLSDPVAFVARYRYQTVKYDASSADYVYDSLTAGFQGQVGTTITYRFEWGPGRVRQELREEITGTVGYAEFVRQIRSDAGFRIGARYSVSDSGRIAQLDPGVNPVLQVGGASGGQQDFAYVREGPIEYFSTFGHLKYRITATIRDINYKISQEDVSQAGGGVVTDYEFTPKLVGFASGNYTRSDYPELQRLDDDILASAGLRFRFQRNWDTSLAAIYRQRDSTDPAREYEENNLLASVSYRYSSQRTTAGERRVP